MDLGNRPETVTSQGGSRQNKFFEKHMDSLSKEVQQNVKKRDASKGSRGASRDRLYG